MSITDMPERDSPQDKVVANECAALPDESDCAHEKLVVFSCKRRGFCPSCGARRMAESAAYLVDHAISCVPVRQWVVSYPIPLRILFAAHPELLAPVLRINHRVIASFPLKQAGRAPQRDAIGARGRLQ